MTIETLMDRLNKLGVRRFCFRDHHGEYEAMVINDDGDVFGVRSETVEGAAIDLLDAIKTKKILGGDGWKELLNPNLN
jgi:hypothetical protein